MSMQYPHLIVIAGPNGAGKSTTAPSLLKGTLEVQEFLNDAPLWHNIKEAYGGQGKT